MDEEPVTTPSVLYLSSVTEILAKAFLKPNTTNNSLRGAVSDARIVAENDLVEPGFPLKGRYLFGPKSNGDHWQTCLEAVERYDNDKCQGWREDIDTLLVFVRYSYSDPSAS